MKPRKLSEDKLTEMQTLLIEGNTPKDISSRFGVAISSVHNYKNLLKSRGITLPNVRGQRPRGLMPVLDSTSAIFDLIVNGIPIKIGKHAKNIIINDNSIIILL